MFVIHSFFSAFLMYSRIPMPSVEWKEENRRYALCFFPLIGAVIGALLLLWYQICLLLGFGALLFATGGAAIPIVVTGGIHLDGFCDVCDAKASCGSRWRMFEIMSDSHIGAFAAIKLALYLLLQGGIFAEIYETKSMELILVCGLLFVLSRALSGLAAVTFKSAKSRGTLQQFTKPAHRGITIAAEGFFLLASCAAMLLINLAGGIGAVLGAATVFVYYRVFSYRTFGGITGDLAGYFLQLCELAGAGFAVLAYAAGRLLI